MIDYKDATCTKDGYTIVTCSVCGYEISSVVIPATGHITAELSNVSITSTQNGQNGGSAVLTVNVALTFELSNGNVEEKTITTTYSGNSTTITEAQRTFTPTYELGCYDVTVKVIVQLSGNNQNLAVSPTSYTASIENSELACEKEENKNNDIVTQLTFDEVLCDTFVYVLYDQSFEEIVMDEELALEDDFISDAAIEAI